MLGLENWYVHADDNCDEWDIQSCEFSFVKLSVLQFAVYVSSVVKYEDEVRIKIELNSCSFVLHKWRSHSIVLSLLLWSSILH
jgi:hypothetical protein